MLWYSHQNFQNEVILNHIYQSIITTDTSIPPREESPPSYEQVMNDDNPYRFKTSRSNTL